MQNLVEIRDLRLEATTDAGNVIPIIKGVSLDIAPGEILALIGESGSGKTTIALTLMAHTRRGCRITGGSVRVNGRDLVTMTERQRQALRGTEVAYVPQSAAAAFNPALTLMDQVIEVARIHRLMPMAQARAKAVVAAWMKSTGHRKNILNCRNKAVGVGVARGGTYGIYWTQDFGTR